MINTLRTSIIFACLLIASGASAIDSTREAPTLELAATLHRAHLAYMANTKQTSALLTHALSRPHFLLKVDKVILARAAAEYGLLTAAERYYRIADPGHDTRYTTTWLNMARSWYKRGRYDQALAAIDNVAGYMTDDVARAEGRLTARILLALHEPEQAAATLRKSLLRYDQPPIARYNLGVALIQADDIPAGIGELNAIATSDADTAFDRALRDKANLVLAYASLKAGEGGTALALLERIRLDGPFSNVALLGLGWAELAPTGETQGTALLRPIRCFDDLSRLLSGSAPMLQATANAPCGKPQMYRMTDTLPLRERAEEQAGRYQRALVAWRELAQRSGSDLAIQEALVAVGYAYRELGDLEQASHQFEQAISRLSKERQHIQTVLERLQRAPMPEQWQFDGVLGPEWVAQRWNFPAGDHEAYLLRVVTDNGFRLTAKTLRELYHLHQQLAEDADTAQALRAQVQDFIYSISSHQGKVPAQLYQQEERLADLIQRLDKLRSQLAQQMAAHDQRLRLMARHGILIYKEKLETYLRHARLGRAGLYHATSQGGSRK